MMDFPGTDPVHQPNLLCRSQSFGRNVWFSLFEDLKVIIGPGCGGEDDPGSETVDPQARAGPLHGQTTTEVLHPGPGCPWRPTIQHYDTNNTNSGTGTAGDGRDMQCRARPGQARPD